MYPFFDPIVRPLLEAVDARILLEIGADQGEQTELVQQYCRDVNGHLHVIETMPSERLNALLDDDITSLHVGTSHDLLETLPSHELPGIDAALIDGDHNYFTVLGELERIANRAQSHGHPLPLLVFHDVGWPYGRRDMYYEPERIPPGDRQPFETLAIRLGESELVGPPGNNFGFANATTEGGARNGVLTAIEDFAATQDGSTLLVVPGLHGLGILAPRPVLEAHPDLAALLAQLTGSPALTEILRMVEHERLAALQQVMDEAWDKAHAQRDRDELRDDLAAEQSAAQELARKVEELTAAQAAAATERDGQEAELAELRAFRDEVHNHPLAKGRRGLLRVVGSARDRLARLTG